MPAITNDAGDILVLGKDGDWVKPKQAVNPQTGEKLYFDGEQWKPVPVQKAKTSGIDKEVRDLGLGVRYAAQGLASVPGMIYDSARAVLNTPTAVYNMFADKPAEYPFGVSSASLVDKAIDSAGLPQPETEGGGMMGAVVRGGASAIPTLGAGAVMQGARVAPELGAILAAQPASQMGGSIGSSAAAEYAKQKGAGPITQGIASLGGGVAGAGLVQGVQGTGRALAAAAQPFTQAGREKIAADVLLHQSSDPISLATRLADGVDDQARRLPGSPVSTAVAARDPGLMVMEQGLRSDVGRSAGQGGMSGSAAFRDLEAQRNASRLGTMEQMADGLTPDVRGASIRGTLNNQQNQTRQEVSRLYNAIDPESTTAVPVYQIGRGMFDAAERRYGPGGGAMPTEAAAILDEIRTAADAGRHVDFRWMQNVRSRLGNAAGIAAQQGDQRAAATLGEMRQALDDAVGGSISRGQGFTPDQRAAWTKATAARRDMGERFGRNEAGNSVVGQILRRDQFGAPMMPDENVTNRALSSLGNVKQVLSAAGGRASEVSEALRGAFVEKMIRATRTSGVVADAQGNVSTALSAAEFDKFMRANLPVAEHIFGKRQMENIKLLASDFSETAMVNTVGRARGSDTAQNVSVANFIARASNGLIDPAGPGAQSVASLGGLLRVVYAAPEAATREIITRAAVDPKFAQMLLAKATPDNLSRASNYLNKTMGDRVLNAAVGAATRQSVRTGLETADQER